MTFNRGDMTFTDKWMKPVTMNIGKWLAVGGKRKWLSKKGELPSQFIVRVIKDMEKDGRGVWKYIKKEMEGKQ